jgi:hypothetical protein
VIASTVNYTLATILRPVLPGFCTSDTYIDIAIFSLINGQTGLIFALEIESSHGLEWF